MRSKFAISCYFNSIKVRLKQEREEQRSKQNFNSIKVRLEHEIIAAVLFNKLFQFHKGTIRTLFTFRTILGRTHFNSIKVRLELSAYLLRRFRPSDFNSIKVRLELPFCVFLPAFLIFQFHKGTIRTLIKKNGMIIIREFQFHKGTIRTGLREDIQVLEGISIP